ncbi:SDR family NAD(P)-dependent oxidoreductase [Roseibium aggregatum]|uniref:SDR family oxidoreductase n=1 Tax=Roseibium aggregatum TaxID=187304 RepID=A0A926P3F2_9HYPH|nr:SDR family oxidoreductase [Roseibium aggregatum]MBD1549390.1 SDR family oxidoreductase [Roseibium aggregatum]
MRVLLTGASEGIGGATCQLLARQCADSGRKLRIVMTASGGKPAPQALLDDLHALGAETLFLTGDLAQTETCRDISVRTVEFCGELDLFVSNAGGVAPGRLADIGVETWDRQFDLNVRATFLLAQALYPALKESAGSIIAVASMSGMQAHMGQGAYSPAKAALISLCRNLAQEWAADGIRVNSVSPGMVRTPLTERAYADTETAAAREALVPLGRIGTPEDIAEIICFLGSSASSYVTGQNILADGGLCDSLLGRIPGIPKRQ